MKHQVHLEFYQLFVCLLSTKTAPVQMHVDVSRRFPAQLLWVSKMQYHFRGWGLSGPDRIERLRMDKERQDEVFFFVVVGQRT